LIVERKTTQINFKFPFRKREKIYDEMNKTWIGTATIWINKLKF
jgi:hypothetical protein